MFCRDRDADGSAMALIVYINACAADLMLVMAIDQIACYVCSQRHVVAGLTNVKV